MQERRRRFVSHISSELARTWLLSLLRLCQLRTPVVYELRWAISQPDTRMSKSYYFQLGYPRAGQLQPNNQEQERVDDA